MPATGISTVLPDRIRMGRTPGGAVGTDLTRTKILQGAAQVFARQGTTDVTVEDILRAAKTSRRTFYEFFGNSAEVLDGLFEVATDLLIDAVREAVAKSKDPWTRLEGAVSAYLDLQHAVGPLAMVLESEAIRPDSRVAPRRALAQDPQIERAVSTQGRKQDTCTRTDLPCPCPGFPGRRGRSPPYCCFLSGGIQFDHL